MKFSCGDVTDKKIVAVLFHEFTLCEMAFDRFVLYAGSNIMGNRNGSVKLHGYNAYSEFLSRMYEFYNACFKRHFRNTSNIPHDKLDCLFNSEVKKLMNIRKEAIEKGYAPVWENDISYYQDLVPPDFGKDFRDIRNISFHADFRRAGGQKISLMDFYNKYHKYVHLLYSSAQPVWSGKIHKDKIDYIEHFDFSINNNQPACAGDGEEHAAPAHATLALIKKDIAIPQNKTKHICKKRKK